MCRLNPKDGLKHFTLSEQHIQASSIDENQIQDLSSLYNSAVYMSALTKT